jgi:hypothetical protein
VAHGAEFVNGEGPAGDSWPQLSKYRWLAKAQSHREPDDQSKRRDRDEKSQCYADIEASL